MNRIAVRTYIHDPHVWMPLVVSVTLLAAALIDAYIHFFGIRDKIIFHLNFNREIDVLGTRKELFLALAGFALLGVMNVLLSYVLYVREKMLSYLTVYANAFIMLLGLLFVFFVAGIN